MSSTVIDREFFRGLQERLYTLSYYNKPVTPRIYNRRASSKARSISMSPLSSNSEESDIVHAKTVFENWNIDLTECSIEELMEYAWYMVRMTKVYLGPKSFFMEFVMDVEFLYRDIPYHNFTHAVYVLHGCCMVLRSILQKNKRFSNVFAFSLIIAALAHDIGHEGVCIDEVSHVRTLMSVQSFHQFVTEGYVDVAYVIDLIMCTSMSVHGCVLSSSLDDDRELLRIVLHAVDVANHIRPGKVGFEMALNVMEEQKRVFDTSEEIRFVENVVKPLWLKLAKEFPDCKKCFYELHVNLAHLELIGKCL